VTRPLALSTMYAQQDRFADGAAFARYVREAGYDGIEISHSTRALKFQEVIDSGELPITSVHQPAPWAAHADGRGNTKLNLASTEEGERAAAVKHAIESIQWAARIGATRSICHLGAVGDVGEQYDEELQMRRLFDSGHAGDRSFAELREAAVSRRADSAEPALSAARKSLVELVRAAEPHGIAIGLENRYHFHEIPHPFEYDQLLDGLAPEQAGYWHDVGHAEVLHRLGFLDRYSWLNHNSKRCIGAHLHDVLGIGDHRAPGDGDVDWGYLVRGLGHLPAFTLEVNQHQPDEAVRGAIGFLERVGLR
jgi:sugar phosphate isomerase/epimerase